MRKIVAIICCGIAIASQAQHYEPLVKEVAPKLIEWRRHFHQNPELSNREFKTGEYIAAYMRKLGLAVQHPVAKTGVVAILKGGKPGPVIGLRADIDALPVTERVNLPFASKVNTEFNGQQTGVMHACGHDSHTAILMGTAEVLVKMQQEIAGTVVFVFQPAEEGSPAGEEGGAALMIKEGVLKNNNVEVMFGLHIKSEVPIGTITYKAGSVMASSDWFQIKVKGKQTHGSKPWQGIDPIVVGTQIISGLQTIVSRQMDLTKAPVVITVGRINGGIRENIIPEEISMAGTIRTLDYAMQKEVHERIKQTATSIAASFGATAEVSIDTKTLVTFNNVDLTKNMLPSFEKAAGKENVKETRWETGAEDFSFFAEKVPAIFFFLGGMPKGNDPKKAPPHHTPDFYIDDSMLDVGVKAFCQLVFDYPKLKK